MVNQFLTKIKKKKLNGERVIFSTNGVGTINTHMQKINFNIVFVKTLLKMNPGKYKIYNYQTLRWKYKQKS